MTQQEITKKILDHFIMLCELSEIMRKKQEAVSKQEFELAVEWRCEEKKLLEEMMSYDDLKKLRDQLNTE